MLVEDTGNRINIKYSGLGPRLPSRDVNALGIQGSFSEGMTLLTASVSFLTEKTLLGSAPSQLVMHRTDLN